MAFRERGDHTEASEALEAFLSLEGSPERRRAGARHWLAVLRGETTATAPAAYVAALFDGYAERFDAHLVEALEPLGTATAQRPRGAGIARLSCWRRSCGSCKRWRCATKGAPTWAAARGLWARSSKSSACSGWRAWTCGPAKALCNLLSMLAHVIASLC